MKMGNVDDSLVGILGIKPMIKQQKQGFHQHKLALTQSTNSPIELWVSMYRIEQAPGNFVNAEGATSQQAGNNPPEMSQESGFFGMIEFTMTWGVPSGKLTSLWQITFFSG